MRCEIASLSGVALFVAACGGPPSAQPATMSPSAQPATLSPRPESVTPPPSAPAPAPSASAPQLTPTRWEHAYDLDGDGKNDEIVSEFTGGAHCCYHVGAALSSTGTTIMLPFEMDGGYVGGAALISQPSQFAVRTRVGSLPEIVYQIATYDGIEQPLDPAWTKRWKIHSHRVTLCFAGGTLRVRDEVPDLPPCAR
jgi:hypothetical protein